MTMRRVPIGRPTFPDAPAILQDVERVLASGRLMIGPYLERFEAAFAQTVGCRYAVGVSSCTAALEIVLRFLRVEGAEVIVPTNTFIATPNAVRYAGGRPVLADIRPETLALDVEEVRQALSPQTKAVIMVHLAGFISPDLPAIQSLCEERGVALIEDCAHAHGAVFDGTAAGAFGLAGCFSFYPTKILTTGAGGMITTNNEALCRFARTVRVHGRRGTEEAMTELGNDWFLDEMRSVVGWHQLRHLNAFVAHRRALAQEYLTTLRGLAGVAPLVPDSRCQPSYYRFPVVLDPPWSARQLRTMLQETYGVETDQLYDPPCHLQPVYQRLFGFREGMCPVAEAVLPHQVCLPVHMGMSLEDARYVSECLAKALSDVEVLSPRGGR